MRSSFAHDGDASVRGNLFQQNVAADPAGAASCRRKGFAAFDGRKREGEVGNENDGANGPGGEIVVQNIEIRRVVGEDGAFHLRIGGVENLRAERFGLALQLEWRFAFGAGIVERRCSLRSRVKLRRIADGTKEI